MSFTQETKDRVMAIIAELIKNDKITKGNIEKFRLYSRTNFSLETDTELFIALSDVASMCTRDLDRRAANRQSFSGMAERILNFDWTTVGGCIGFERQVIA